MLYINVNNIFFKSYSVDPLSGHAIYVFDSTYLPSSEEVGDKQVYDLLIDNLMDKLIAKIPSAPFILVVFSSGFLQKKISWVYGIKMFSKLPKELRAYLQKAYIVHESFFIKTVYQVLTNALNIKTLGNNALLDFSNSKNSLDSLQNATIVHVADLTDLSALVDITRLRISLNVYLYDYQFSEYIDVPRQYFDRLSPLGARQYRQLIFDKIFKRLELDATKHELVFQRPGSYKRVNILLDIIERNNYIDLSQWDIYSLASVFLHFLKHKSLPLIPIDLITLPISDDFEYTYATFCSMVKHNQYWDLLETIFPLFIVQLEHCDVTMHDPRTLSKALCPPLCQEKMSMMSADRLAIGTRFIRNLLEHFPEIIQRIDRARMGRTKAPSPIKKVDRAMEERLPHKASNSNSAPQPPRPRKLPNDQEKIGKGQGIQEPRPVKPTRPITVFDTNKIPTVEKLRPPAPQEKLQTPQKVPVSSEIFSKSTNDYGERLSSSSTIVSEFNDSNNSNCDTNNNGSASALKPRDSVDNLKSRSTSLSGSTETISQMVTDNQLGDTNNESDTSVSQLAFDDKKVSLQHSTSGSTSQIPAAPKILQFDKELRTKRLNSVKNQNTKFSHEGYSDIKAGSKVSKLAALYEERLQGLQAIEEIKKKDNFKEL
ncbi:hypothetical protein ZYGM_003758 [Zygosaccharomyces mellis]|uniref:Rho-GAP domain-containing protein n=1 Tax=Zygosaccharomyces mellis TaxID=42258 RepID=A0A4C2E7H8_9SACH|nr:hypothetical protein ZYGM_003758 [Zygosaccharomyces mellis]